MRETPQASGGENSVSQNSAWLSARVQHHVEQGVAVVDDHVQVGEGARDGAPGSGFPRRGSGVP